MRPPKVLIIPGSNRTGSHSARLAGAIYKMLALRECEVHRITLRDYEMPIYDGDYEMRHGPPPNAITLARLMHEHDGVIVVSPEYNASIPPLVKNTLDWVSLVRKDDRGELAPYRDKLFALASASTGKFGGVRCLYHLRAALMNMGAQVLTEQLSLSFAAKAFDEKDLLVEAADRNRLEALCTAVIDRVNRFAPRI